MLIGIVYYTIQYDTKINYYLSNSALPHNIVLHIFQILLKPEMQQTPSFNALKKKVTLQSNPHKNIRNDLKQSDMFLQYNK